MIRKVVVFTISISALLISAATLFAGTTEESFKKDFPAAPEFESIQPSTIPGLYEVVLMDGRIAYYAPQAGSVILGGQILTKEGKNVTRSREVEITEATIKKIPLDKAIKIGDGKNTVIEFVDPDCPYSREATQFISIAKDLTRYVFFVPLGSHPDAIPKIRYIYCSKDKAKAYEEAMAGKLDDMKFEICADPKVDVAMSDQEAVATKVAIKITPVFFINGKKKVVGADLATIQKLLNIPVEGLTAEKTK